MWRGTTYEWTCLPFGLGTAPKTFTRVAKCIVVECKKLGITIYLYLDDGLILAMTYEKALADTKIVLDLLERAGFLVSWNKCALVPSQQFTFLGLNWNTVDMTISVPEDKLEKIRDLASTCLARPKCRPVMRLLGMINYASWGIPLARLKARPIQMWLNQYYLGSQDLFKKMELTPAARAALEFWAQVPPLAKPIHRPTVDRVIVTDASTAGYGGALGTKSFAGQWPGDKGRSVHINILELETAQKALELWQDELTGKTVSLQMDNRTAVAYLLKEGGTKSPELCQLAGEILALCAKRDITVLPSYLRGMANTTADALSRGKQVQEWKLQASAVNRLFKRWGRPDVDLFASSAAHQVQAYFSLDRRDTGASGGDALQEKWPQGLRYAFPPPPSSSN